MMTDETEMVIDETEVDVAARGITIAGGLWEYARDYQHDPDGLRAGLWYCLATYYATLVEAGVLPADEAGRRLLADAPDAAGIATMIAETAQVPERTN